MRLETWREQRAANEDGDAPVNLFPSEKIFRNIFSENLEIFFFQKKGHAAHVPEYTLS